VNRVLVAGPPGAPDEDAPAGVSPHAA